MPRFLGWVPRDWGVTTMCSRKYLLQTQDYFGVILETAELAGRGVPRVHNPGVPGSQGARGAPACLHLCGGHLPARGRAGGLPSSPLTGGPRVQGSGFRGSGFKGSGLRAQGSGLRAQVQVQPGLLARAWSVTFGGGCSQRCVEIRPAGHLAVLQSMTGAAGRLPTTKAR